MVTTQRSDAGSYYNPANKFYTAFQSLSYRVANAGWAAVEYLDDFAVLAEVRLRAIAYRIQALTGGSSKAGHRIRHATAIAAGLTIVLVFLLVPADALFRLVSYAKEEPESATGRVYEASDVSSVSDSMPAWIPEPELIEAAGPPLVSVPAEPAGGTERFGSTIPGYDNTYGNYEQSIAELRSFGGAADDAALFNDGAPVQAADTETNETVSGDTAVLTWSNSGLIPEDESFSAYSPAPVFNYIWPADGTLSSKFGKRNIPIGSRNHRGIDIAGRSGQAIYAAGDGKVVFSGWSDSYGYVIRISHDNGDETVYGHCRSLLVRKGAIVSQGDRIARMGETGIATGVHLHFELIVDGKNVNPILYLPLA